MEAYLNGNNFENMFQDFYQPKLNISTQQLYIIGTHTYNNDNSNKYNLISIFYFRSLRTIAY